MTVIEFQHKPRQINLQATVKHEEVVWKVCVNGGVSSPEAFTVRCSVTSSLLLYDLQCDVIARGV